jgi:benzoate membrane transport protein
MRQDLSMTTFAAGTLAAFVGFAGSFAIVFQGLKGVGANAAEATSGVMALAVSMGLCAIFLAIKTRMPISVAWSTPGAAFLATLAPKEGATALIEGGFPVAVGAFIVTALLIIFSGLWKPLGRAVSAIPTPLASAMLAGVLLPLCLAPFKAIAMFPLVGLAIIVVWAVVARIKWLLAVPAAVIVAGVLIVLVHDVDIGQINSIWSIPFIVTPSFTTSGIIGITIPLFIITMAAQNVTGIAVLNTFGYRPDAGAMFSWTGLFSLASAPFGGHAVNLAAITTAICAGNEAHPDPDKRYWAAIVGGINYIAFGLTASAAIVFITISPPILIAAVAGLALFGALSASFVSAMESVPDREAALITFLVTASGMTFFGISGVFWGLLAGSAVYMWDHRKANNKHK